VQNGVIQNKILIAMQLSTVNWYTYQLFSPTAKHGHKIL